MQREVSVLMELTSSLNVVKVEEVFGCDSHVHIVQDCDCCCVER